MQKRNNLKPDIAIGEPQLVLKAYPFSLLSWNPSASALPFSFILRCCTFNLPEHVFGFQDSLGWSIDVDYFEPK